MRSSDWSSDVCSSDLMMRAEVQGVDFLVANTDAQALKQSSASSKIQLGAKITQGLGAGSRPEIGRAAAEETIDDVTKMLDGAHMCFIAAGLGGGTGTGAAPRLPKAARHMGIDRKSVGVGKGGVVRLAPCV